MSDPYKQGRKDERDAILKMLSPFIGYRGAYNRIKRGDHVPTTEAVRRAVPDQGQQWQEEGLHAQAEDPQAQEKAVTTKRPTTRERVRELARSGVTPLEISARLGLSENQVYWQLQRLDYPSSTNKGRAPSGGKTAAKRCKCGQAISFRSARCQPCSKQHQRSTSPVAGYAERIREHAAHTGLVPTAREASLVLGLGRSRAADIVREAFGPDPLSPARRKHAGPRRYLVNATEDSCV